MRKLLFTFLSFSSLLGFAQPTSFFTGSDLNMQDGYTILKSVLSENDTVYEAVYGFNPIGPSPNFNFVAVFDKEGHFTHNKYFGPINLSYVQLWGFFYIPFAKSYAITGSFDDGNRQMIWPMNFFMDSTWQLVAINQGDTVINRYQEISDSVYCITGHLSQNNYTDRHYFIAEQNIKSFEIYNIILVDTLLNQFPGFGYISAFKNDSVIVLNVFDSLNTDIRYLHSFDKNLNLISSTFLVVSGYPIVEDHYFVFRGGNEPTLKQLKCLNNDLSNKWSFRLDSTIYTEYAIRHIIKYQQNKLLIISEVFDSTYVFSVLDTNGYILKEVDVPEFHKDTLPADFRIGYGIGTSDGGVLLQIRSINNEQWAYLMKMDTNFHVLNSDYNFYIPFGFNTVNEYTNATEISLFPNPTTSHFTIQSNTTIKSLTVYNLQGQQVLQKSNLGTNSFTIEVQLPSGVYVVKVETTEGVEVRKVLVGSDNGQ